MNCNANKCIECTVRQCAYHCDTENYCSLDKIQVGTQRTTALWIRSRSAPMKQIPLWTSAPTACLSGRNDPHGTAADAAVLFCIFA